MAEDHGAREAGHLPRVWTKGRRETKNCCTNQQPAQRGGAVPEPVWVE